MNDKELAHAKAELTAYTTSNYSLHYRTAANLGLKIIAELERRLEEATFEVKPRFYD